MAYPYLALQPIRNELVSQQCWQVVKNPLSLDMGSVKHDVYMDTEVVDGLDPRNYDQIFKVYVACFAPEEQKLETLKELPWCRFHEEYLFVEPGDKSVGIKMMVDHFKGNYKDVVVFGDEKNDLSMFKDEWTSIAMGNAIDELKEKATYVTTPCDQDGIYNACVYFGWIKEND